MVNIFNLAVTILVFYASLLVALSTLFHSKDIFSDKDAHDLELNRSISRISEVTQCQSSFVTATYLSAPMR